MTISTKTAMVAAHSLYTDTFIREFTDGHRGGTLGKEMEKSGISGIPHEDAVWPLSTAVHAEVIYTLIGRLWQAWGRDPGLVFRDMYKWLKSHRQKYISLWCADEEAFSAVALYATLMACKGTGVTLIDVPEMAEAFAAVSAGLRDTAHAPFQFDESGTAWYAEACERLDRNEGYDKSLMWLPSNKRDETVASCADKS